MTEAEKPKASQGFAQIGMSYVRRYKYVSAAMLAIFSLYLINGLVGWSRTVNFDASGWLSQADKYSATIRRDKWGVPHVHGKTDADVAFGAAYVHAREALADTEASIRLNKGLMGLHTGGDGARSDWLLHLLGSHRLADTAWLEMPAELRAILTAYADGLNFYAAENSDKVDQTLYPVSGQDLVAASHFQQAVFYGLDQVVTGLLAGDLEAANRGMPEGERGSNAIAVSPGRGWGATRLLINSHQPMTGPFSWYEMRLISEQGWDIHGGTFPGSPFIYLGVNRHLGWGATVNRPGLTDLYKLETHPRDPRRYRFNDLWWDMDVVQVEIPVKLIGNFFWTFSEELEYSRHGPVFRIDGEAYALHYPGMNETRQNEQWYRMNRAKNRKEWRDAMRMRALPSLNFVYADEQGNIDFLYNASFRKRPPALVGVKTLPGNTSAALELPLVPFEELPQLHNPATGWVASTNQTPLLVTGGRDNLPAERYGSQWRIDRNINNRALRAIELLGQPGPVNAERMLEIKLDKAYSQRFDHLQWRNRIRDGFSPDDRLLEDAQRELLLWDLKADAANTRAALGICMIEASMAAEDAGETFELIRSMRECGNKLEEHFGTLTPVWGDVLRLRRGEQSWPLGGGPDLLRAIHSDAEPDGTRTARAGDGLTIVAGWQSGLQVTSVHQFGSSRDPLSDHYADQAPLFSREEFRPPFDYVKDSSGKGSDISIKVPF